MKIYIDIGHGEKGDPGAVKGTLVEHQMNIVTGYALAERLKQHGHIVKIEPGDLTIDASAREANAFGATFMISQHYNAGGGDRGEVIYSWKHGADKLANACAAGLKAAGQTVVNAVKSKPNKAGKAEYFGILRGAMMPGVIIEPVFLDNVIDRQIADTEVEQKRIGVCIADAIAAVYGSSLGGDEYVSDVKIVAGGKFMTGVILKDGKSYAPVRELAESLGCKVKWDDMTHTVTVDKEGK